MEPLIPVIILIGFATIIWFTCFVIYSICKTIYKILTYPILPRRKQHHG